MCDANVVKGSLRCVTCVYSISMVLIISYSHASPSDLNVNPGGILLCDVMGKENGSFQAVTFLTGENRNQYLLISQGSLEKQLVGCVCMCVCVCVCVCMYVYLFLHRERLIYFKKLTHVVEEPCKLQHRLVDWRPREELQFESQGSQLT